MSSEAVKLKNQGLMTAESAHSASLQGSEHANELLAEASRLLREAYDRGAREPEVVWPLRSVYLPMDLLEETVALLKDYLQRTADELEGVVASHYVVDCYALMASHEKAFEHHVRYLEAFSSSVPSWRRLWSLSDGTMTLSWQLAGEFGRWLALTESLYEDIASEELSEGHVKLAVGYYLRTLSKMHQYTGEPHDSIASARAMLELYEDDESAEALRLKADALCSLIEAYNFERAAEEEEGAAREAIALSERPLTLALLAEGREKPEDTALSHRYREVARTVRHNLGCALMRVRRYSESRQMLTDALRMHDRPLTRFFLAGVLLKTDGDRTAALENLKRTLDHPREVPPQHAERMFLENPCFEGVREDPEFLRAVRAG